NEDHATHNDDAPLEPTTAPEGAGTVVDETSGEAAPAADTPTAEAPAADIVVPPMPPLPEIADDAAAKVTNTPESPADAGVSTVVPEPSADDAQAGGVATPADGTLDDSLAEQAPTDSRAEENAAEAPAPTADAPAEQMPADAPADKTTVEAPADDAP